jgi:pimeloyl-ACP methyl ester carboxylesterase
VHTGPATVYLPPQYGDPAYADRRFPVLELTSGFPASPSTWFRVMHLDSELNYLIATGRSVPFIAVVPVQNVASPRDTECVDAVGGPQVDSYLSYDVHTAVERAVRAGSQWTVLGDSTGGYCAADLLIRHPDLFTAAVSIAGYDAPAHDATTGDLFGNRPELAALYSPLWLLRHRPQPDLHLLLITTRADRYPTRQALLLAAAARPPFQLSLLTLPRGGHNFGTFAAEVPVGVSWLSRYVPAPLAPLPTVDGLSPVQVQHRSGPDSGPGKVIRAGGPAFRR